MKYLIGVFLFPLFVNVGFGQQDCERVSSLIDSRIYNTEGTARLVELANGSLELRLESDFMTNRGPDVQIFLSSDSVNIAGGVMIADIAEIGHFSGARTFEVPEGVGISDFDHIVFRCFAFRAHWGSGRLGANSCGGDGGGNDGGDDGGDDGSGGDDDMDSCQESATATTDWVSSVTVCPNDGEPDRVPLQNTLFVSAGDEYAYVVVDQNNLIVDVVFDDSYNFEGSSLETQFVFGFSYRGDLNYTVGSPMSSITATGCLIQSNSGLFLTVNKENCGQAFECFETNTATTNWVSSVTICPSDGEPDVIPFLNNQFIEPGPTYAFLLTDENLILQAVMQASSFDFEGSGTATQRVYGISFDGELNATIGASINTITATNCAILSDPTLFLTINKGGCAATLFSARGTVRSPDGQPIQGAEIVNESGLVMAVTSSNGSYSIPSLQQGASMRLSARPTSSILGNGVTSTDLVLVTRHILSFNRFSDPYQILAADANNSGSISASDLVEMRRIILEQSNGFTNNTNWRFVRANQDIAQNVANGRVIQTIELNNLTADATGLDFIGVKIGDVNNSANLDLR